MRTPLLPSLALLVAVLQCALPAVAQVKTEPKPARPAAPAALPGAPTPPATPKPPAAPKPPVAVAAPGLPPTPAFPAQRKLSVLQIPLSELAVAVDLLQRTLEDNGLEQLNILFGPDIRELDVSSVTLRNVTGPDALQLIAAAAGCTVEPMYSTEAQPPPGLPMPLGARPLVIGYQLRGKPKPPTIARTLPGAGGPPPMSVPGGIGGGAPRSDSATSPTGRLTRIYPLGAVTRQAHERPVLNENGQPKWPASTFSDLEKTLREVLKADGVAENQVTLAFHEKTNVLVVNAAEPVHGLVEQLLRALTQNGDQTSAFQRILKLQTDLAERDKELRELQKELRQLQNPAPKPPSAK